MITQVITRLAVALLLTLASWFDLKQGRIPGWLLNPPLLATVALWAWRGEWVLLLLFALFLATSDAPRPAAMFVSLAAFSLPACFAHSTEAVLTAALWTAAYTAWLLELIGGGDAKAAMIVLGLFPHSWPWLCGGALLVGLLSLINRCLTVGSEDRTGAPLLPGLALGFLGWCAFA